MNFSITQKCPPFPLAFRSRSRSRFRSRSRSRLHTRNQGPRCSSPFPLAFSRSRSRFRSLSRSLFLQDSDRACYGPKHVEVAHDRMAIQTLLITDEPFRNADVVARQRYANLVKSVKDSGGTVHIFSSLHVSGEQLAQITGIAAILRFPLPDLDDIEM